MDALQIRRLPEDAWQGVADAMAAGRPVKEILAEYLPKKASPAPVTPSKCYARLVDQLGKALSVLQPHVDQVAGTLSMRSAAVVLGLGIDLLEDLRERELAIEQQRQSDDDLDDDFDDDAAQI